MNNKKLTVALLSLSFLGTAFAVPQYYTDHTQGWKWYQGNSNPVDQSGQAPTAQSPQTATQQMDAIHAALKESLDQAIIHPTDQNVRNYVAMQNAVNQHSTEFSDTWKRVLLQNPKLDESLKHPTSQLGRQVEDEQRANDEQAAIHALTQKNGFFFFYRSTCPYCQRFAPILKDFAEHYHIAVVPITTDGQSLPAFPNSVIDSGQAKKFHVDVEPALFLVDPYTNKAIPVSYGLLSQDELKQRMYDIATHFKGDA